MAEGQIYKIHSDFYYVNDGVNNFECKVREILKKRKERILVGDFVEFGSGVIEKLIPRKNFISRPSVANIDRIIIVSALKEPDLNFEQLNRYIALAKYHNIEAVLCFNKSDLKWDRHVKNKILDIYEPLGYEIVFTSATEHKGLKEFERLLKDRTSVLCGGSGAGKSSLVNALNPELNLRTKQVSEKIGFSGGCKYSDCLHKNEDGCAVLANLDKIDLSRYESYLNFVNEAMEFKERVKYEGLKIEHTKKVVNNREVAKISGKKRRSARNTLKQQLYKELDADE